MSEAELEQWVTREREMPRHAENAGEPHRVRNADHERREELAFEVARFDTDLTNAEIQMMFPGH